MEPQGTDVGKCLSKMTPLLSHSGTLILDKFSVTQWSPGTLSTGEWVPGFQIRPPMNLARSYSSLGWKPAWMLSGQINEYKWTWSWRLSSTPHTAKCSSIWRRWVIKELEVGSVTLLQPHWCRRYTWPSLADTPTRWDCGGRAMACSGITMETCLTQTVE